MKELPLETRCEHYLRRQLVDPSLAAGVCINFPWRTVAVDDPVVFHRLAGALSIVELASNGDEYFFDMKVPARRGVPPDNWTVAFAGDLDAFRDKYGASYRITYYQDLVNKKQA